MCETVGLDSDQARAICHLRYFLYREYGEVRHLGENIFPSDYENLYPRYAEIRSDDGQEQDGLPIEKRAFARRLYVETLPIAEAEGLVETFATGHQLTLEQLRTIFGNKKWANPGYAGPKHRDIVKETIALGEAIKAQDWAEAEARVGKLRIMEHNNRLAILDYVDLRLEGPCCILPEG